MKVAKKTLRGNRLTEKERAMPWWLQQARENPKSTAVAVASTAGGLLLLAFFCQLGEMPDLDLAGASSVVMAVAVVGFVFAAALTGCAIGAGLMLRGDGLSAKRMRSPLAMLSLALPGWLSVFAVACYFEWRPTGEIPPWAYAAPIVLMVILACVHVAFKPDTESDDTSVIKRMRGKLSQGIGFLYISYFWLLTAAFAFLTLFALHPRDGDGERFLIGAVGWTTWCYLSNMVLARAEKLKTLALLAAFWPLSLVVSLTAVMEPPMFGVMAPRTGR